MLTLYYAPGTCSLASHIALVESKAEFNAVRLSFVEEDQRKPDYLAINPKGRVPALVTDRGILTETPAILLYLAQSNANAGMAPLDDPFELARLNSFNTYLCSTVHVAHAHRGRGYRWADDPGAIANMQAMVAKTVGECFRLIEEEMFVGPYVMGNQCSVSDFYLFTLSQWLEGDGVDVNLLPAIRDFRQRMSEHASVVKALANEAAPA